MAGFNPTALKYSQAHLDSQVQAIYDTLPHIVKVYPSDASSGDPKAVDLFADYILGVDGIAVDMASKTYKVSFKSRLLSDWSQDLRLECIKLTDNASRNNDLTGFMYKGNRYSFESYSDINVQWIRGRNYVFTGSELQALALQYGSAENELVTSIQEKYSYDRNGTKFFSGKYYVFLDKDKFCDFINELCQKRTAYQSGAGEKNA